MDRSRLTLVFTLAMFLPFAAILALGSPQPQQASLEGGLISFALVILILRTAARAVFRDIFSASVKVAFRSFTRIFLADITDGIIHKEPKVWEKDSVSFLISWAVMGTSLALITYLKKGTFEPALFLAVLVPFGLYIAAQKVLSKMLGAAHNMRLFVDGILLQAYFTGSHSFLPITHENEISGDRKVCALVVTHASIIVFLATAAAYLASGSSMWLDVIMLFQLVNTFPLQPMDGWYVYRWNKKLSLLLFIAALLSFAYLKSGFAGAIL